jgi:hypothetical protein
MAKSKTSWGSRKKSIANSNLSLAQDDYSTSLKNKGKLSKNITIETSKNSSLMNQGRPMSWAKKSKVGMFRAASRQEKSRKSNSPLVTSRINRTKHSVERLSCRSNKRVVETGSYQYNRNQKGNLKIWLNDIESAHASPHSIRTKGRDDTCKNNT